MSDLVAGLVALMDSNYTQPVNIGNPEEKSINTFATLIRDTVNSSTEIVHNPAVEDDPQRRRPDISIAKTVLSWLPRVSLEKGLAKTIEYFSQELRGSADTDSNNTDIGVSRKIEE